MNGKDLNYDYDSLILVIELDKEYNAHKLSSIEDVCPELQL